MTANSIHLPEIAEIEALIAEGGGYLQARVLCEVALGERRFPVHAITFGNPDPELPAIGFFGGVHGLERIGAEVVIAYLRSLVTRLSWDDGLHQLLKGLRLVFMPLVNPGGLSLNIRANPGGVDLMRNAPVECTEAVPFLLGGHRLGRGLPWFRGETGRPMELESTALCALVESELLGRRFSLAVDCHSGFGAVDRIWFPYAHTRAPITHLGEMHALHSLFERNHPHHPYVFEPQSRQYLTHGDLWDYLYQQALDRPDRVFLPLTLEMGSWLWLRKNPRQMFLRQGFFNPLIAHRQQRVMRRHLSLLDFLMRAAASNRRWLPAGAARHRHRHEALARWYPAGRASAL